MSNWEAKRFWKSSTVDPLDGGFTVLLDGRPVRTPAKAHLVVPTTDMAQAIAGEWDAVEEKIDPTLMPVTRAANASIDKVSDQFDEVAEMIAAYGDSDLICYRAEGPDGLVRRQSEQWDPLITWSGSVLGAPLRPVTGVIHAPQDAQSLAALSKHVFAMTAFELAALHDLVSLSGSLVIGLAAARNWEPAHALWERSRVDELWQIEAWGHDEEASRVAEQKRESFLAAFRFYGMSDTR